MYNNVSDIPRPKSAINHQTRNYHLSPLAQYRDMFVHLVLQSLVLLHNLRLLQI